MSELDKVLDYLARDGYGTPIGVLESVAPARAELAALRAEVGRLRAAIDNAGNGLIRTLYDQDSVVVDGWAWRQLFEAALARKEKT